jgi:hypothetical protein
MPNILENYLSVQDGEIYHIKTISPSDTRVVFYDETYQSVGKGKTNLEKPFTIPNAQKFSTQGIKVKIFNLLSLNETQKLPLFHLKLILGETEVFNLHLAEVYPTLFGYQQQDATEGSLSTRKFNLIPIGNPYNVFGFTKGLEVDILQNVTFRVEAVDIENIPTGGLSVGIFLVGTLFRTITG